MSSSFYAEAEQGIGIFYANGTIISIPGSSNTVTDNIPNATSASIGDGNWSLVVEYGIVKKFNAPLVSSGKWDRIVYFISAILNLRRQVYSAGFARIQHK